MDKSILKQFLKAGYIYQRNLFPTNAGTPQGGIISPVLSNIALDGIHGLLEKKYHLSKNGRFNRNIASRTQVNYIRYADDFIVTAKTKEIAEEVKYLIQDFLKDRGLELSKEKTLITNIEDGFDFLGWNFRKYKNGKLLIKPSKKSIQKFIKAIRKERKNGFHTQQTLIKKLNPVIIGWSNYHQGVVSRKIFEKMDAIIWNMLWKWAKRNHQNKSHAWIIHKYWHPKGTRKWTFSYENYQLTYLSDKKIIRTTPIKLDKNPFLDKDYWIKYKFKEGSRKLTGRFKRAWDNQNGICPDCKQLINIHSDPEDRPLHHKDGNHNNNAISNLVYKHAHCHRQQHALNSKLQNTSCLTKGFFDA